MSTISSLSSMDGSASASYATQLAQTSKLRRSLNDLGNALERGDLSAAGSVMTSLAKNFPQYAVKATTPGTTQSTDPINQGFQTIGSAISANSVSSAQTAWTQLKSDLAKSGVTDISDGSGATAQLLADTKSALSKTILANALGAGSSNLSASNLIGGTSGSDSKDPLATLINDWVTYKSGGSTSNTAPPKDTGANLNTTA